MLSWVVPWKYEVTSPINPRLWALSFMFYEILFVTHSCPILNCLKCWSRKCNNFLVILDSSRNVPSQQNIQNVALKNRQTGLTNETRRSFEGLRIKTLGCWCRCCCCRCRRRCGHRRWCRRCCCCRRVVGGFNVASLRARLVASRVSTEPRDSGYNPGSFSSLR